MRTNLFLSLCCSIAIVVGVGAMPRPVLGQPPPTSSTAEADKARELYVEGDRLYAKGDFVRAEVAFKAAWGILKNAQIAYNLGDCELRNGKPRDAAEHLAYASRSLADPTKKAELQNRLDQAMAAVHTLRLAVLPAGADVSVDGQVVATSPLLDPIFLTAGEHTIEVKKAGFAASTRKVTAKAGASSDESVDLTPESGSGSTVAKPIWPYFVLGGVAALGLGLGIGFTVESAAKTNQAADLGCTGQEECISQGDGLLSDSDAFLGVGAAGVAIAGAAIVGMIIYGAVPASATPKHARLTPWVAPTGGGLLWSGEF